MNYIFKKKLSNGQTKLIHKELDSDQKAIDHASVFKLELIGKESDAKTDDNGEPEWSLECHPI